MAGRERKKEVMNWLFSVGGKSEGTTEKVSRVDKVDVSMHPTLMLLLYVELIKGMERVMLVGSILWR